MTEQRVRVWRNGGGFAHDQRPGCHDLVQDDPEKQPVLTPDWPGADDYHTADSMASVFSGGQEPPTTLAFWSIKEPGQPAVIGHSYLYEPIRNVDGTFQLGRVLEVIAKKALRDVLAGCIRDVLIYDHELTEQECEQVCLYLQSRLWSDVYDWDGREIGAQWDEWIAQLGREVRYG